MALDFAVTSGMRDIPASIRDAASATQCYEDFKRAHLDTKAACTYEGFGFTPMVVEAVGGGWALLLRRSYLSLTKKNPSGPASQRIDSKCSSIRALAPFYTARIQGQFSSV